MFESGTNGLRPPAGNADAVVVASISLLLLLAGATAVAGAALSAVAGAAACGSGLARQPRLVERHLSRRGPSGAGCWPQYALMLVKNENFKVR